MRRGKSTDLALDCYIISIGYHGEIALVLTIFQQHGGRDVMKEVIGPAILMAGAA